MRLLNIVNFVPKVQALDKSAATLAEIRRQLGPVRVLSVIGLTEKHQIERIDSLVELVARVSDRVVFVGHSTLQDSALYFLQETVANVERIDEIALVEAIESFCRPAGQNVYLMAVGSGNGKLNDQLVRKAKSAEIPILGYFKSLHDEGMGLSTLPESTSEGGGLYHGVRQIFRQLRNHVLSTSVIKKDRGLTPVQCNWLMVFNASHAQTVIAKAGKARCVEMGYQLLFPAWRDLVAQSPYCRTYPRGTRLEVVLFTRGETPGRPPEENVVPHANLVRLLDDIVSALDDSGRDWHLRIKPHPIQDVGFLRRLAADRANIEIVYEAPALLAATADLAISTYSSTVVDTLAFGVPTIEYFFETPFFRAKHPTGSPFPELGAMKARCSDGFRQCMQDALQEAPREPFKMLDIKRNPNFAFLADLNADVDAVC